MAASPLSFHLQQLTQHQPCPVPQELWVAILALSFALCWKHKARVQHLYHVALTLTALSCHWDANLRVEGRLLVCQGSTGIQLALQVLQGRSAEMKGTCRTPRDLTEGRLKRAVRCARYQKAEVWRWEGSGSTPGDARSLHGCWQTQ